MPGATDNSDVLQIDYDIKFPVDSQPTQALIDAKLKEIANEFAKYLLKRLQYTDFSSEACTLNLHVHVRVH